MSETLKIKRIEIGFSVTREIERTGVFEWSNGQLTISTGLDMAGLEAAVGDVLLMLSCWKSKRQQEKVRPASIKEEK